MQKGVIKGITYEDFAFNLAQVEYEQEKYITYEHIWPLPSLKVGFWLPFSYKPELYI